MRQSKSSVLSGTSSPRWRRALPFLILAAGLWAYHNSFQAPFLLDDEPWIVQNPHLRSLSQALQLPPRADSSWRPVLTFSLALNHAWSGPAVWSYHLANLIIHLLAALALYGVVRWTLKREGPALAAALIWVVHPLNTHSVTYIIQRAESLAGLCYLLTLYSAIRAAEPLHARRWSAASVVSCALGMGTKPVMATAPVMVWLYDRTFLRTSRPAFYAALAAAWVILAITLIRTPATARPTAGFGIPDAGPLSYLLTQPGVILHYLTLSVWPDPLCFDDGWPLVKSLREALVPSLSVAALVGATIRAVRRRSPLGFLGAWVFLILLPTSVVPLADPAMEYRMYLPLAGIVTGLVVGGWRLLTRLPAAPDIRRWLMAGAVVELVLVLGQLTILRNADYRSAIAIWSDTVIMRPHNARAHSNLGVALAKEGKMDGALHHFAQALHLKPAYAEAHYNLGLALRKTGHLAEAREHLSDAVRLSPHDAEARHVLAQALAEAGKTDEALAQFADTIRLDPRLAAAHYNYGVVLVSAGRLEEAINQFEEALRLEPGYQHARDNLNAALARQAGLKPFPEKR